jgi:hypothetical protein
MALGCAVCGVAARRGANLNETSAGRSTRRRVISGNFESWAVSTLANERASKRVGESEGRQPLGVRMSRFMARDYNGQIARETVQRTKRSREEVVMRSVFVGRMEVVTPEMKADVASAIRRNDRAALRKYGRFLEPISQMVESQLKATHDEAKIGDSLSALAPKPSSSVCQAPASGKPASSIILSSQ